MLAWSLPASHVYPVASEARLGARAAMPTWSPQQFDTHKEAPPGHRTLAAGRGDVWGLVWPTLAAIPGWFGHAFALIPMVLGSESADEMTKRSESESESEQAIKARKEDGRQGHSARKEAK